MAVFGALAALSAWLLSPACPSGTLAALQASTILTMALGSRLPQIVLNWRRGNAGMLSVISCGLNVAGNAARIFTTLVLTRDPLLLGGILTQGESATQQGGNTAVWTRACMVAQEILFWVAKDFTALETGGCVVNHWQVCWSSTLKGCAACFAIKPYHQLCGVCSSQSPTQTLCCHAYLLPLPPMTGTMNCILLYQSIDTSLRRKRGLLPSTGKGPHKQQQQQLAGLEPRPAPVKSAADSGSVFGDNGSCGTHDSTAPPLIPQPAA